MTIYAELFTESSKVRFEVHIIGPVVTALNRYSLSLRHPGKSYALLLEVMILDAMN